MSTQRLCYAAIWTLSIGTMLFTALPGYAWQQGKPLKGMPGMSTTDSAGHACDDMASNVNDMSVMARAWAR